MPCLLNTIHTSCHHAGQLTKADRAKVTVAAICDDKTLLKVLATVTVAVPALTSCTAMQLVLLIHLVVMLCREPRQIEPKSLLLQSVMTKPC